MADGHKNFAYSTLTNAPSTAGTSLIVQSGDGAKFPTPPFNATVWPSGVQPISTNAEIVRVTGIATDTLTITRNQESSTNRDMGIGDQIAASITAKILTDIEASYVNSYSPYVVGSGGTGLQTLATGSSQTSSGSLFLFPFKVSSPIRFNQILLANSLSMTLSATTQQVTNAYSSKFGIYSMLNNSVLSLISSNSFSIGETLSINSNTAASLTWNYPTSTATTGYAYGSFPAGNLTGTAQMSSYISGSRVVGLQFGGEMSLTGNDYWLGVMSQRATTGSAVNGLSNAGIIGMVMNPINMNGTISGILPLGIAGGEWQQKNTHVSGWFGRYVLGIVTATSQPNFGGTKIPDNVSFIEIGGAAAGFTGSIMPTMSFVST